MSQGGKEAQLNLQHWRLARGADIPSHVRSLPSALPGSPPAFRQRARYGLDAQSARRCTGVAVASVARVVLRPACEPHQAAWILQQRPVQCCWNGLLGERREPHAPCYAKDARTQ
jgi:hypothetical protein